MPDSRPLSATPISLLLSFAFWGIATPGFAEEVPEHRALTERVKSDKSRLKFLRSEERSILVELSELDLEITDHRHRIRDLKAASKKMVRDLNSAEQELGLARQELLGLKRTVSKRLLAIHRMDRTSMSALLRRTSDPSTWRRLRDRLRIVSNYDTDLIRTTRELEERMQSLRDGLAEKKKTSDTTQRDLSTTLSDQRRLRGRRAALLRGVRKERSKQEQLAREIRRSLKRLEAELGRLRGAGLQADARPGGFADQSGSLPWPVTGRVVVPFGKKVDPISKMVLPSKGIDIQAGFASPVRSVHQGHIVYAAWFEGFGRIVIVEHDKDFRTLYAHLGRLAVKRGQAVERQQILGFVGDSALSGQPRLHFAVRKNGQAVDPLEWLN